MTTPVFLETDETAFDTDRALTAEHGRRLIRNALAIYNERCGHVGYSERLVGADGAALSTRVIITANWAYHGPIHYFCPAPVGQKNQARATPFVRLLLTGRATGLTGTYVYVINESLRAPTEPEMDHDILGSGTQWAEISTADWSITLEVPITPGWNKIWIGWKCGLYGEQTDLSAVIDTVNYQPFIAEVTSQNTPFASSHPSILTANVVNESVPPFAIILSVNPGGRTSGYTATYTCPLVLENPAKNPTLLDGMYFLWEPFRNELEQIGPILQTNVEASFSALYATSYPIVAFRQSLDVINLDSLMVDGSQVWQLEDNDGAGLRWWQLPSALQYRQAANLAESARRAVCPMVSIGGEVTRPASPIPYPLAGSYKPYSWALSETGTGTTQYALLSLNSLPPFQIPSDTVILEYCLSICVVSHVAAQIVDCLITADIRNWATGVAIIQNIVRYDIIPVPLDSGSVSGYCNLTRTISWALAYNRTPNAFCDYGQEGLTLRGDFQRWQEVRGTLSIPRTSIPTDPVVFSITPTLPVLSINAYYIAQSQLSVRIAGQ
jgi:hypothetical protein